VNLRAIRTIKINSFIRNGLAGRRLHLFAVRYNQLIMNRKKQFALCLMGIIFTAYGCSIKTMVVNQTADVLSDAGRAFTEETDLELAELTIPASIKTIEGFLYAHPKQPILLKLLAEAYLNYGAGFLEDEAEALMDEDPDESAHLRRRAREFYSRARNYGLRLLHIQIPELAKVLRAGHMPSTELLSKVGSDEIAGLFWTGMAWLAYINQSKSDPKVLSMLPIAKALLERSIEIDESYYYAGAWMSLAAVDAGVPAALGGNPDEATRKFKKVAELTQGKFLMNFVLYGKMVGLQTGNKQLYLSEMRKVLKANPDVEKDLALANRLAQRRASRYLAQAEDLFL